MDKLHKFMQYSHAPVVLLAILSTKQLRQFTRKKQIR